MPKQEIGETGHTPIDTRAQILDFGDPRFDEVPLAEIDARYEALERLAQANHYLEINFLHSPNLAAAQFWAVMTRFAQVAVDSYRLH